MITMEVEKITPKKATEYLKKNINNPRGKKSISRKVVNQYAEDMKAGLWQLNGEAIVFDEDGYLKDGQHRLAAVITSGATIEICVVRGVPRETTIYDIGWKRTISQMVNAELDNSFECNSTIASAAGLIVNNFRPANGYGRHKQYIQDHIAEFERAYRIACYGGNQGSPKSKCASCIAATYLALRTDSVKSYELELFFRIFNNRNTSSGGYDPTPAVTARRMFDERKSGNGYQIQKEKLEIITLGLQDFHDGNRREDNYKLAEPFHFEAWMDEVRGKDGLES